MAEASESMTTYHYALNNLIIFNDPLGDQAKMTIFDILNTISAHDQGYGGRWSSSNPDNVFTFNNNKEGFAIVTDRLDLYGGWETTAAGNFETAWANLNGNISATGFGKEIGLRGVNINETSSNANWLITRLNESGATGKGIGVNQRMVYNGGAENGKPSLEDMKNNPPNVPGYIPPKSGARKGNSSRGKGWVDRNGNVWVPDDHGGTHAPHWDVQPPKGPGYSRVYPFVQPAPDQSLREKIGNAVGLSGAGLTIYIIISEGSRLFPPRNLIPIP